MCFDRITILQHYDYYKNDFSIISPSFYTNRNYYYYLLPFCPRRCVRDWTGTTYTSVRVGCWRVRACARAYPRAVRVLLRRRTRYAHTRQQQLRGPSSREAIPRSFRRDLCDVIVPVPVFSVLRVKTKRL